MISVLRRHKLQGEISLVEADIKDFRCCAEMQDEVGVGRCFGARRSFRSVFLLWVNILPKCAELAPAKQQEITCSHFKALCQIHFVNSKLSCMRL